MKNKGTSTCAKNKIKTEVFAFVPPADMLFLLKISDKCPKISIFATI
jgi:hypothetical protein